MGSAAMTNHIIKSLFSNDIHRRIEEVIKVDQTDEEILHDEINEYVVTDAIRSHYTNIFDAYRETPNKPHEGIAIWVSGFFGSGKSSFAKMLGLSISNRSVAGESAADRFAHRTNDKKLQVLLKAIAEKIPTHAVIFDVLDGSRHPERKPDADRSCTGSSSRAWATRRISTCLSSRLGSRRRDGSPGSRKSTGASSTRTGARRRARWRSRSARRAACAIASTRRRIPWPTRG